MLSKERGWGAPQLWTEREEPAVSRAGAVGGPEHETPGYSVRPREPTQCPECLGWRREGWGVIGGPVFLSWQGTWQMPRSGPELGPRGLRASAVPVFVHKGPLTCTGPECGPSLGPSVCAGTGTPGPQAPRRAVLSFLPWPWWQLVSWDGGGRGFALQWGWPFLLGPWAPRPGRATPHLGEHGPSGRCPH